jgi:NAD(P)-dependent dehydrogenase (short-subunit alcohol dehydrogenase family)
MGNTVLITGASRGLGLEFVRQYTAEGWTVHACARAPESSQGLRKLAEGAAGAVRIHTLDVTDSDAVAGLARKLRGEALDLLINNAGIYGRRSEPLGEVDEDSWIEVLRTNTIAPLKVAEAFVENVAASRTKIIATVSSLMGSIADNSSGGNYPYRTSKAGANMVAKGLAVDLKARGIISVALNPGWVRTDMGGAAAALGVERSVRGMRKVLEGLTRKDSGRFFHYTGEELPW